MCLPSRESDSEHTVSLLPTPFCVGVTVVRQQRYYRDSALQHYFAWFSFSVLQLGQYRRSLKLIRITSYKLIKDELSESPEFQNLDAYMLSVTMKSTVSIQALVCATIGGATSRSMENRGYVLRLSLPAPDRRHPLATPYIERGTILPLPMPSHQ